MNEPICAVCGETDIKKLTMFNYGVCLCNRCNEIAAHAFINMHNEKKLKAHKEETKNEYEERIERAEKEREGLRTCAICGKDIPFTHPNERVHVNVNGKAVCPVCEKKIAELHKIAEAKRNPDEAGRVVFLEGSYETKYWNLREKHMNTIQRVKDLTLKMNKIDEELHRARKAYDSAEMDAIRKTLDMNRCNKIIDNLKEEFSVKVKAMNYWLLGVSILSGVLGFILGYCYR